MASVGLGRILRVKADTTAGRPIGRAETVVLASALVGLSLLIRLVLLPHVTYDYAAFLQKWWVFIETHGGFAALKHEFANYNPPYLYLMALLTYVTTDSLIALKLLSVAFDVLIAFYTYRIIALRQVNRLIPVLGATAVMLLPTVFINSAMWAQCDSIFTAFCVAGLYYLLRKQPWVATVMFGVALSFKLQAVFVFPVLLILVLRRQLPWRTLLAIPAALIALDIPAWLAGRSVESLASIYLTQGKAATQLTVNAPSVYQFMPNLRVDYLHTAAVLFAGAAVLLLVLLVGLSRRAVTTPRIVLLATTFAILVPYFLPAMHERYFFVADVLSVAAAFYVSRLWYLPILVQFASFTSYQPFLFGRTAIDLRFASVAMTVALVVILREVWREFAFREIASGSTGSETVEEISEPPAVVTREAPTPSQPLAEAVA